MSEVVRKVSWRKRYLFCVSVMSGDLQVAISRGRLGESDGEKWGTVGRTWSSV